MTALIALIRLTRPANAVICALSVLTGAIAGAAPLDRLGALSGRILTAGFWNMPPWQWRTVLAAMSAALILAAGNVLNDVRDIDCDRINAPHRPLPARQVSPAAAIILTAILALGGIVLSLPLGRDAVIIACGAALLLVWYDLQLKRVPLAGNAVVALLGGFAFIYGGIAGGTVGGSLIPAAFATFLHLGREIIKDGADVEGDSAVRIDTLATVKGVSVAARRAALVLGMLGVLLILPYGLGWFGRVYLAMVIFAVMPVLVYCVIVCLRNPSPAALARLAVLLKAVMLVGLLAVLAGFQWR